MQDFLDALTKVGTSLWELIVVVGQPLLPWAPLAAWVAFWLLAVNWVKLREKMAQGGWIVGLLLAALAVLIWGTVAPYDGKHSMFGLQVTNFVEKTIYVSILTCIALLAGSVQMSGNLSVCFSSDTPDEDDHGHGHDGHGHDAHGHDAHGHVEHGQHDVAHATVVQSALH